MNFGRGKVVLLATVFALVLTSSAFAGVVYTQPFDGTGNAYSSQNDTTGGNGNFATVYDNFTLGTSTTITEAMWTGEYFNPPAQGVITGWTISFYANTGGQPGSALVTTHVNGTGGETFLGNFAGFPTYTYDVAGLNFAAAAGTTYWMSVVPDLGFPPQWGWSAGTGGDGVSYQDFFGTRTQLGADMAFTLLGNNTGVPEPGTLVMLGTGVLGLAGILRRKINR
jgi:hypothetical protein